MDESTLDSVAAAQRVEITEHLFYEKLADLVQDEHNRAVLKRIAREEKEHHDFWREYTKRDAAPRRHTLWKYLAMARIFGITFAIKLMERGEDRAQTAYEELARIIPESRKIIEHEDMHEKELIAMIDEERLRYVGSMVLGLNDALVELTGALAGFTFAFLNSRIVAMTGLITGIAAALSMATSSYLSTRADEGEKKPGKAAVYTGAAYMITVMLLILPFLLLNDPIVSITWTVINAVIVILVFTYYISVAKDLPFKKRFIEMCAISLGIAGLTFIIGFAVRTLFGIEV